MRCPRPGRLVSPGPLLGESIVGLTSQKLHRAPLSRYSPGSAAPLALPQSAGLCALLGLQMLIMLTAALLFCVPPMVCFLPAVLEGTHMIFTLASTCPGRWHHLIVFLYCCALILLPLKVPLVVPQACTRPASSLSVCHSCA